MAVSSGLPEQEGENISLERRMLSLNINLLLPQLEDERERSLPLPPRNNTQNCIEGLRTPVAGLENMCDSMKTPKLQPLLPLPTRHEQRPCQSLLQRPRNPVSTYLDPCPLLDRPTDYRRRRRITMSSESSTREHSNRSVPSSLCLPDIFQHELAGSDHVHHDRDQPMMIRPRPKRPRLSTPKETSESS